MAAAPLLELVEVRKLYPSRGVTRRGHADAIRAVDGVTLAIEKGKTLGLVGESGCGKTTLARLLLQLVPLTSGKIMFQGTEVSHARGRALRSYWRHVQLVFQDPYSSLNPRLTARELVAEPLRLNGIYDGRPTEQWIDHLLEMVGIDRTAAGHRYPAQFSGGQRQRIAIARALALRPEILVLDEPTASLDVSIQAQVLNLLKDIQAELGCTYIFISHDLAVIRQMADTVAVMYLGRVAEQGDADAVLGSPHHPYTTALLSSVPGRQKQNEPKKAILSGDVPSPAGRATGCAFRTRCWKSTDTCEETVPALERRGTATEVACHFPETAGTPSGIKERGPDE